VSDEAATISAMSCVADSDETCTLICVISRTADNDDDDDDDGSGGGGGGLQPHYHFVSQARLTLPTHR